MIPNRCKNCSNPANTNLDDELVLLVIGACTLDRSLVVPSYPMEDSKIRATSYHEGGGGNASNTAAALAKLSSSSSSSSNLVLNRLGGNHGRNIRIRILSKVGSDPIGYQLRSELEQIGVDVSFLIHQMEATSSHTTIIVSSIGTTRTCIHYPGTCGELTTLEEISSLEDVFRNVIWVHFDTRHTDFSLALAKEAVRRGIHNISVDIEKDRGPSMTELVNLATICFTSATHLHSLLERTTQQHTSVIPKNSCHYTEEHCIMIKAAILCHHFRYQLGQYHKEIVVTNGDKGSFHVKYYGTAAAAAATGSSSCQTDSSPTNDNRIPSIPTTSGSLQPMYDPNDRTVSLYDTKEVIPTASETVSAEQETIPAVATTITTVYQIHHAGVLRNIHVVDTTGAGDCFIAGFILSSMLLKNNAADNHSSAIGGKNRTVSIEDLSLMIGSWVAGKKIGGLGTRCSLPSGADLDTEVGTSSSMTDLASVRDALTKIVF